MVATCSYINPYRGLEDTAVGLAGQTVRLLGSSKLRERLGGWDKGANLRKGACRWYKETGCGWGP